MSLFDLEAGKLCKQISTRSAEIIQKDIRSSLLDLGAYDGRKSLSAVDEGSLVLSDDSELSHRSLELGGHVRLVGDESLPCAGGTRVTSEGLIGLEA